MHGIFTANARAKKRRKAESDPKTAQPADPSSSSSSGGWETKKYIEAKKYSILKDNLTSEAPRAAPEPNDVDLSQGQRDVLAAVQQGQSVFFTGVSGTVRASFALTHQTPTHKKDTKRN